jgi:hypothetical protein
MVSYIGVAVLQVVVSQEEAAASAEAAKVKAIKVGQE